MSQAKDPNRNRLLWIAFGGSAVFLSASFAAVHGLADEQQRLIASDLLFPVLDLLVTLVSAYAAQRSGRQSSQLGLAWWALALSQFCWFLGDLTWAVLELGLQAQPYPSLADVFYLAYYVVFLAGILLLPVERQLTLDRVKQLLDIGVVILAASLLFWNFWLGALAITLDASDPVALLFSMAYPVGDLVLIWAIIVIILRPLKAQPRLPLVLLGVSALAGVVSDIAYAYQTTNGTYVSGSLVDLGWIAVQVLALWAAALQAAARLDVPHRPLLSAVTIKVGWFAHARLILPYASVAGAYWLLLFAQRSSAESELPMRVWDLELAVAALVVLVIVRQILTLSENVRLSAELRAELGDRHAAEAQLRREIAERGRIEDALRKSKEQLTYEALHDILTGLPNRALFMDRLERSVERAKRNHQYNFAVLFLDFDGFKVVNDSLGHPVGDRLLVEAAGRLQKCLRSADTVARLGGDEFVVLLEDIEDVQNAKHAAGRLQAALSEAFELGGQSVSTSASIGIVLSGSAYQPPDDIVRDADIAMYQAKQAGKARHAVFDVSMRAKAVARMNLESDLRGAFDRQEFHLNYQPILDMKTRRIAGFEALLRWRHPRLGYIPPAEFIPIAEDTGLIVPIGEKVLWEACRQLVEWQTRLPSDPPHTISVNLSARQFRQANLVEQVEQALRETGLEPGRLNLEVTESVLIEDAVAAVATMSSLRALGVHLHIDDFGTGYSSLSYLYRFPIDALKIDRAFIARLDGGGRNSRIVHNIVMLAHDLGLSIIAEGAETPEQVAMIEALGCEQVQGYVISRPLESARVVEFLACLHDKPLAVADPAAGIATMCQAGRIFECGGQLVVDN